MGNTYLNINKFTPLEPASFNPSSLKSGAVKGLPETDYNEQKTLTKASGNFTSAIYGNGPYSLEHPNNTTDVVAQMCDYLA